MSRPSTDPSAPPDAGPGALRAARRRRDDRPHNEDLRAGAPFAPQPAPIAYDLTTALAALESGHWLYSLRLARRGEEEAGRLGDRAHRLQFFVLAGKAHLGLDNPNAAIDRFETVRDACASEAPSAVRVHALIGLGTAFGLQGDSESALNLLAEAHRDALHLHDQGLAAEALIHRALTLSRSGRGDTALAELERAERMLLGAPDTRWLPQIAHTRGDILLRMRRWLPATRAFRQALAAPGIEHLPPLRIRTSIDLATALTESGHWKPVLDLALGALHESQVRHLHTYAADAALLATRAALQEGDTRTAGHALAAYQRAKEDVRSMQRDGRLVAAQWAMELRQLRARVRRDEERLMTLAARVVDQQTLAARRVRAAQVDVRSGLVARSVFEDAIASFASESPTSPFCLLMVDTSPLIALQSEHGRHAADMVRGVLIAAVRSASRQRDPITDYGTGELLLFCPGVGDLRGARIAQALRDRFVADCQERMPHLRVAPPPVGVLYGRGSGESHVLTLLTRLDRALARARSGEGDPVAVVRSL